MRFAKTIVRKNFVPFFVQRKCINGKERECKLGMKAAMNVEVVESAARSKTLSGNIQKVDMASFLGLLRKKVEANSFHFFFAGNVPFFQ